jgi:ATP-dependent Clp protease ATP-binding subunit ClpC
MELTPRVTTAFQRAQKEAEHGGHSCIGSQHVLLGLYLLGNGVQYNVLVQAGLTAESLRGGITQLGPYAEEIQMAGNFVCGTSTVLAMERATKSSQAESYSYLGTERLLLALLDEESGPAADLLTLLMIDKSTARQSLVKELSRF